MSRLGMKRSSSAVAAASSRCRSHSRPHLRSQVHHQNPVHLTMKKQVLMVLMGVLLCGAQAFAQQKVVTGRVTNEQGAPMSGVQIVVKGTGTGTLTNAAGVYSIRASVGQVLKFSFIGTATVERPVGTADVINVELRTAAISLEGVEATALGQTAARRSLGSSQQTVVGAEIAQAHQQVLERRRRPRA